MSDNCLPLSDAGLLKTTCSNKLPVEMTYKCTSVKSKTIFLQLYYKEREEHVVGWTMGRWVPSLSGELANLVKTSVWSFVSSMSWPSCFVQGSWQNMTMGVQCYHKTKSSHLTDKRGERMVRLVVCGVPCIGTCYMYGRPARPGKEKEKEQEGNFLCYRHVSEDLIIASPPKEMGGSFLLARNV